MKLKEKLELLLAFLILHGKIELARQVAQVLELLEEGSLRKFIFTCKELGLSDREIRLIWEAQYNNA